MIKKKISAWIHKSRYLIFFFALLMLYNYVVVNRCSIWRTDHMTYMFHLVDYSMGFCTKFLPGAIYQFLFRGDNAEWKVIAYETVLLSLLFLFVAYMLSSMITARQSADERKTLFVIFLFYLTGPCTFAIFTLELGMLDVYWLFLSAAFVFAVSNKYLKFTVPLIFLLSVLVHFSALISCALFYLFILLYEVAARKNQSGRGAFVGLLIVSFTAVLVAAAYFMTHESANLTYDMRAFNQILNDRNQSSHPLELVYYDFDLYKFAAAYDRGFYGFRSLSDDILISPAASSLPAFLVRAINAVWAQLHFHFSAYASLPTKRHLLSLLFLLAVLLPVILFIYKFWFYEIRSAMRAGQTMRALVFLLATLHLPAVLLVWYCFSWDVSRYVTHAFLTQFTFFLYVVRREADTALARLKTEAIGIKKRYIVLYMILYASVSLNPYI